MTYLSNSDFSLFTDSDTGEVYSNLSKLALMCGVSKSTLSEGVRFLPCKTVETLTAGGLQGVRLYDENTILEAVQHYAFSGKTEAQNTLKSFSKIGLKVVIQTQTGFSGQTESVKTLVDELQDRWDKLRGKHSDIYAGMQLFGGKVTDQLNLAYYGVTCKEFKAARVYKKGQLTGFALTMLPLKN